MEDQKETRDGIVRFTDTGRAILTLTDASILLSQKITSNRIAIEAMDTEIELNKKIAKFRINENRILRKKKEYVNEMNEIFAKQIHLTTDERQAEIRELYKKLNDLDDDVTAKELVDDIRKTEDIWQGLLKKHKAIEELIPDHRIITNYIIKQKEQPAKPNVIGDQRELEEYDDF